MLLAYSGRRLGALLNVLQLAGQALLTKNYPAPNVKGAELEKPCYVWFEQTAFLFNSKGHLPREALKLQLLQELFLVCIVTQEGEKNIEPSTRKKIFREIPNL